MERYRQLPELLELVDEPFRTACNKLLTAHRLQTKLARGSTCNHQAWPGGYLDHVREVMNIAISLYEPLNTRRPLPFLLSDALLVLFLHDLEKPWAFEQIGSEWRRAVSFRSKEDAHNFRLNKFTEHDGMLTDELKRAVYFTEGEIGHYSSTSRAMNPLAAFCHMCDVASARIWFDHPAERDDPWSGANRACIVTESTEAV